MNCVSFHRNGWLGVKNQLPTFLCCLQVRLLSSLPHLLLLFLFSQKMMTRYWISFCNNVLIKLLIFVLCLCFLWHWQFSNRPWYNSWLVINNWMMMFEAKLCVTIIYHEKCCGFFYFCKKNLCFKIWPRLISFIKLYDKKNRIVFHDSTVVSSLDLCCNCIVQYVCVINLTR